MNRAIDEQQRESTRTRRRSGARRALVALTLVATMGLAACSGGTGSNGGDAPSASSAPETTATETHRALQDPRTITGPSHAEVTKFIEPVASNPAQKMPVTFTDHTGKAVTITDASRVLALDIYGTFAQTIVGLGLKDRLVGRTASDTEPEVQSLPLVTQNGHELNGEAILALSPTLIITDTTLGPAEVIEQLKASGVTVVTLDSVRTLGTVRSVITDVSTIMGVPDEGAKLATAAEDDIKAAQAEIKQMAPASPLRMAVLYVRGNAGVFFIFGKGLGTDELIQGLGGLDVASANGIADIKPANAEALAQLNPEVILVMTRGLESTGGVAGLLARPGVGETTAGMHQRIIDIDDGALLAFGPNTGNVLRALAEAVYGS